MRNEYIAVPFGSETQVVMHVQLFPLKPCEHKSKELFFFFNESGALSGQDNSTGFWNTEDGGMALSEVEQRTLARECLVAPESRGNR